MEKKELVALIAKKTNIGKDQPETTDFEKEVEVWQTK
jgi:hypothetical protein